MASYFQKLIPKLFYDVIEFRTSFKGEKVCNIKRGSDFKDKMSLCKTSKVSISKKMK